MFIKKNYNYKIIYNQLKNLGNWGHYFNFNNKIITGYWPELFDKYNKTVFYYKEKNFSQARKLYDREFSYYSGGKQFNKLHFIKDIIKKKNATILDLGCNDGMKSFFLESLGFKNICAYEVRLDCIKRANYIKKLINSKIKFNKLTLSTKKNTILNLNRKFDYILSFGILHHLIDHKEHISKLNSLSKEGFFLSSALDKEGIKLFLKRNFFTYKLREDKKNSFKAISGKYIVPTKKEIFKNLETVKIKYLVELKNLNSFFHEDYGKFFTYLFVKK